MNNSDYLDLISALNYSYNFLGSNIAMILRKLEEFNGSETLSACTAWNSIQYVIMGDDNERLPYPIADYKIFTDYVSHKPPKDVEQVHIRFTNHEGDGFLETEINHPPFFICDHINSTGKNPLIGKNIDEIGVRFPDQTEVYSKKWMAQFPEIKRKIGFSGVLPDDNKYVQIQSNFLFCAIVYLEVKIKLYVRDLWICNIYIQHQR